VPLLVHGILDASVTPALAPLPSAPDGSPVGLVRHRRLAALVTPTWRHELLPTRTNLHHHAAVLDVGAGTTTIVPMRFGSVMTSEAQLVDDLLAPAHDDLMGFLQRVSGHVELRLLGRYHEDAVVRAVTEADPRVAQLRQHTDLRSKIELGERLVAGIDRCRRGDTDRAVATLRDHAAGVIADDPMDPLEAFRLAALVAAPTRGAFDAAVDRLAEQLGPRLELELVGPVPPFSFVAGEVHTWA
jgi:hypothetical protein